jgi:methylglyoxal synthase
VGGHQHDDDPERLADVQGLLGAKRVYTVSITFNEDTAEEVAAYSRIDEGEADLLAQDQRVSALAVQG